MHRKTMTAVAVALALASPSLALAQSSVTISGFFRANLANVKVSQTTRTGNNSETMVTDDVSRLIFSVTEHLGGGLAAIGQFDFRPTLDTGTLLGAGNSHVGLRSKSWGRIFFGRQDLHYFNNESDMLRAGFKATSCSLLCFAGGGATAIANATRTANLIHYTTPDWGGFTLIAAYSTNPGTASAEADIGSTARKGSAWNLNPNMRGANWQIGYSYWNSKPDGGGATFATGNQRGDRLYGSYTWSGFKLGVAWDKSKIKSSTGATSGATLSNRTAWSLPASYRWGSHEIHAHYTKARDDKATAAQDGAKQLALGYVYNLSKRTYMGLALSKLRNDTGAIFNLYTAAGPYGAASVTALPGEDQHLLSANISHQF